MILSDLNVNVLLNLLSDTEVQGKTEAGFLFYSFLSELFSLSFFESF